jgi:hypothetical protein
MQYHQASFGQPRVRRAKQHQRLRDAFHRAAIAAAAENSGFTNKVHHGRCFARLLHARIPSLISGPVLILVTKRKMLFVILLKKVKDFAFISLLSMHFFTLIMKRSE